MLILPFPAPACPHTTPTLAGDCGKSTLPGIRRKPVRADLPQTPGRIETTALPGAESQVVCLRHFYARHHPTVCRSPVRHRAEIWERDLKPRQRLLFCLFATVTVLAFAGFLNALRARLAVSPSSEASSKRQGDGQRFQKKAMKTTNQIEASAPANVRPSSVSKIGKAEKLRAFAKHCANRRLSTETVLNYLRTRLPRQYEVAEVVGKWVWLDVSPARKPGLASLLWALGFHWNQRRGVWQHPCGSFNPFGIHPADPRAKYRSYFPADILPA
jgi:hypothetical protein